MSAESDWDNTVAQAAPATPKPNFNIKSRSRATFNTAAKSRNKRGAVVSPTARRIEAQPL